MVSKLLLPAWSTARGRGYLELCRRGQRSSLGFERAKVQNVKRRQLTSFFRSRVCLQGSLQIAFTLALGLAMCRELWQAETLQVQEQLERDFKAALA